MEGCEIWNGEGSLKKWIGGTFVQSVCWRGLQKGMPVGWWRPRASILLPSFFLFHVGVLVVVILGTSPSSSRVKSCARGFRRVGWREHSRTGGRGESNLFLFCWLDWSVLLIVSWIVSKSINIDPTLTAKNSCMRYHPIHLHLPPSLHLSPLLSHPPKSFPSSLAATVCPQTCNSPPTILRAQLNSMIRDTLQSAADAWGMVVKRYEITEITPDTQISEAMDKQAAAERIRR